MTAARLVRAALVAGLAGSCALLAFVAVGWAESRWVIGYDDGASVVVVGAAAAGTWLAARRGHGQARRAWLFLTASMVSWSSASALWFWFEVVRHVDPFPSVADVGYLASVPLAAIGLWSFGGESRDHSRVSAVLDGVVLATSVAIIGWQAILERTFAASGESAFTKALSVAYPLGDVVLIVVGVHVLQRVPRKGRDALVWVVAGLGLFALSDAAFTYLTATGSYTGAQPVDVGWLVGGFCIGAGGLLAWRRPVDATPQSRAEGGWYGRMRYIAPLVALASFTPEFVSSGHLDPLVFVAFGVVVTALVALQALAARDNAALTGRLKESLTLFETVLDNAPIGFAFVDVDGRIVRINEMLARLGGHAAADRIGGQAAEAVPSARAGVVAAVREVVDSGQAVIDRPMDFGDAPGAAGRSFVASYYPVRLDGGVAGVGVVVVDVTEREKAEQARAAVRSTAAKFDKLVQHSRDVIAVLGADTALTYANPAAEALLGFDPSHQVGKSMLDLVHPDDVERVAELVLRAVADPTFVEPAEFRIQHHGGGYRYLETVSTNLLDDPDVGGIVVNGRDVTARHAVEAQLRDSEAWLRAVVTNASDIVLALDRAGQITYASPTVGAMLGHEPEALVGTSVVDLVAPEFVERAMTAIDRQRLVVDSGEPVEVKVRHADGSWRWLEVVVTNLFRDPSVQALVVHGRDVTDRRDAAERLARSEQQFRLIAEHARDLVFRLRLAPVLAFEYVSPAAERITGHRPEEYYENPTLGADVVGEEFVADVRASDQVMLEATVREMPIRHRDGHVVWAETTLVPIFEDGKTVALEGIARDITERKEAETQLAHQAVHDPLTGLPNRVLLTDRINQALARAERDNITIAVLYIDLDRFKRVNDAFGHAAGDEFLVQVADKLRAGVRPSDTVARLGGDEFVVVAERAHDTDLDVLSQRLAGLLKDCPAGPNASVIVTGSVGLAVGKPGDSAEKLLSDADIAMYRAKQSGPGGSKRFDESLQQEAEAKVVLESELRHALDADELVLHYQPVVSFDDGTVHSAEALVRWNHPTRGLLAPAEFIGLAEETGLIRPLGAWVFREACREVKRLQRLCPHRSVDVAVNVSVHQLTEEGQAELGDILREEAIDPARLIVEITESAMMSDVEFFSHMLEVLKQLGLRISIDDFGTGYSSLVYLRQFPVEILKIDKSFVDGIGLNVQDDAVVATIMSLARSLDLAVVAEGVETREQAAHLRQLGCQFAQGYFYARPMPAAEFRQLVADEKEWDVA